jgi:perosamine synthetase
MDPQRRYFFPVTGYNFRLTNIAAAMLCAQLERASEMVEGRRRIYAAYESRLANVSGVELQPRADWAEISPWLFSVTIDEQRFGRSRDELMAFLAEAGIETRPFFIPLHQLPPFRAQSRARNEQLPITDALGSCGLNLPTYVGLTESDIDEICSLVRAAAR